MTQSQLADTIRAMANPLAAGLGLEIWGIELAFGARSLVRVFVELQSPVENVSGEGYLPLKAGEGPEPENDPAPDAQESDFCEDPDDEKGVSVEQCAKLSRVLGLSLEVEDIIPGAYILEVSSPGLDRTYFTEKQLAAAVGRLIDIQLERPLPAFPDRKKFRGVLVSAPPASEPGGNFAMMAEDCPKPEMTTEILFAFTDVKKARQVWLPPEKPLPGKGPRTKNKRSVTEGKTLESAPASEKKKKDAGGAEGGTGF